MFKPRERVKIEMKVVSIDGKKVTCEWQDGEKLRQETFHQNALKKVKVGPVRRLFGGIKSTWD